MGWTTNKAEHARRLAICEQCPHAVLTIAGRCQGCRRRGIVTGNTDDALACRHCGGEMHGREIARCGACGCPLASRVYASCPKKKW